MIELYHNDMSGYAPYMTRLDHLQLHFLWDNRPHIPAWY
jgi:hypothetical protein